MRNNITIQKDGIAISVSVLVFRDNSGVYIVYCPSLDLSGYDNTESTAKDNFSYVLKEWIKEQTANGTLEKDLVSHGWIIKGEESSEPQLSEIIKRNANVARVVSMPEYKKTNIQARVYC